MKKYIKCAEDTNMITSVEELKNEMLDISEHYDTSFSTLNDEDYIGIIGVSAGNPFYSAVYVGLADNKSLKYTFRMSGDSTVEIKSFFGEPSINHNEMIRFVDSTWDLLDEFSKIKFNIAG